MGLILFGLAVVAVLTAAYVAFHRSSGRITAATTNEPYTARQDDLGPFFDDYQPDTRTDFQRSVDAGFVQLPDFTAERRMRQHGRDAFERSVRRTTIRHINTRGEL